MGSDKQPSPVTVLAVDDEPANLELLERVFRSRSEWKFLSASCGERGLDIVRDNGVDVFLVDYSMPTMNGIEFIEKAKAIAPTAIAIMITGYGELDAVVLALNRGLIHHIVAKPWRIDDLVGAVRRALTVKNLRETVERLRDRTTR